MIACALHEYNEICQFLWAKNVDSKNDKWQAGLEIQVLGKLAISELIWASLWKQSYTHFPFMKIDSHSYKN